MKKLTLIVASILLQISLVNCQTKNDGVITYEVTPEFAKKIDKPEVHFKVDIPKSLHFDKPVEGKKTSSYGMVQKYDKDSIVTEMCSFGYIKIDGMSLDEQGISFMKQIKNMLRSGGYKFENSNLGLLDFDGKKRVGLQLIGEMEEGASPQFIGKYRFNITTRENPSGNTHIIFLMAAKDEDESLSYEDFKDKLTISKIWQSFQYIK
ncbi:hypothetical protein [Kordia zhangzhouensis]|uniref:hypothetical protein n=1 Tax=Kordia zhangzhouensis TaxID=1620405 RepID=UPI0006295444|nr:hypothetical protein [Kordia zhangzhouensis]